MEVRNPKIPCTPIRAIVFDFDGTLSTLRCGWEQVMKPMMLEMITGDNAYDVDLERKVTAYIDESTGIQTIHQMKWLAQTVHAYGKNPTASADPWWYKEEYNHRLMQQVRERIANIEQGIVPPDYYHIKGSLSFLQTLFNRGVKLYAASGTDHPDVCKEAEILGFASYFTLIAGAPIREENCSKERVISQLLKEENLSGREVAVIGDGKVEIRIGRESGMRTIGMATNERAGGLDPIKRERLLKAGADVIVGDFMEQDEILKYLGL